MKEPYEPDEETINKNDDELCSYHDMRVCLKELITETESNGRTQFFT